MQDEQLLREDIQSSDDEGISITELFSIIWKNRVLMMIVTLGVFILIVAGGVLISPTQSKVSTLVEFQWNGITDGQYPDGQRFDYGSTFETFILNDAIAEANLEDVTSNDLRSSLTISPIIPNNILETIESALLRGLEFTYHPTQFKITLDNGDLGISVEKAQNVLNLIIDGFREDFERKYVQRSIILDYTQEDLANFDYIDSYEILNSQVQIITNAVDTVLPEGNDFISTQLGTRFTDISVRVNLLSQIELVSLSSRINNYLLSKDKDLLITRYSYIVETRELELVREQTVQADLNTLITGYSGGTNTILIPGLDPTLIPNLDPYLNTLYANLVSSQSISATIQQDIDFYQTRITRLEGLDPFFIVTPEKEAEEVIKVEESIDRSSEVLGNIASDMNIMLTEYNTLLTRNLIKTLAPPAFEPGTGILLIAAIGIVVGGISGLSTVFIVHAVKQNKLSKQSKLELKS